MQAYRARRRRSHRFYAPVRDDGGRLAAAGRIDPPMVAIPCAGDQGIDDVESTVPSELLAGASIAVGSQQVTVVSAHPPHSASWHKTRDGWRLLGKMRTYAAISNYLAADPHVILGMDANAWLDHRRGADEPDDGQQRVRDFFDNAGALGVQDALRAWLAGRADELAAIRRRRPQGTLAVTHVTGGNHTHAERFDTIMIPLSAVVVEIDHNYEDAVAAGSDHAYVRARVQLS